MGDTPLQGKITLYGYTDYLTETLYDRLTVPIQGDSFLLQLRYQEATEYLILDYQQQLTMPIFVEPGGEYEVLLSSEGFGIYKEPASRLNRKIMDYGNYMAEFMKGANGLQGRQFDDFKTATFMKYYEEKNDFFNAYYKYDLKVKELFFAATGQFYMDKEGFNKSERNYLTETKIRLNHPKWGEYFKSHVSYRSKFCKFQRIDCCDPNAACQDQAPYKEAAFFQNDTLRELAMVQVMVKQLEAHRGGEKFDKVAALRERLDSMAANASVEYVREVARQYVEKINLFGLQSQMPRIALKNAEGNLLKVHEMKGKYILLDFWALWCKPCLQEMAFYHTLPEKMKDRLEVVSISVDEDEAKVWEFVKEKGYGWLFLHNGPNRTIQNQLLIAAYPSYFLFSPEGKLLYKPTSISEEWEKIKELVEKGE